MSTQTTGIPLADLSQYGGLTIIVTADSTNAQNILQTNFEISTKCVTDGFVCVVNSQAW